jgi:hypothetical protein
MQPRPAFFTTADFAVRAHDKITTPQMRTMKLQFPTPFQLTGLVPRSHLPIYHLILIAVLILLPAFSAHAQSGSGTLQGRVFEARDGTALFRARVTLAGSARETLTDEDGSFRFLGIPAGDVRLTVSYLGLASQTVSLRLAQGEVATREIQMQRPAPPDDRSEIVKLGAFTVVSDREEGAQAMALNMSSTFTQGRGLPIRIFHTRMGLRVCLTLDASVSLPLP